MHGKTIGMSPCSQLSLPNTDIGNWALTDFPGPPNRYPRSLLVFRRGPRYHCPNLFKPVSSNLLDILMRSYPPYGVADWRKTNRDFTLRVTDPQIVQLFRQVNTQEGA